MTVDELTPQEIAAALAARKELGPDYEQEIAASLADRMQRRIDSEVLARTGGAGAASEVPRRRDESDLADAVTARWTALGSLAAGTAVTVTSGGPHSTPAVVPMAWIAIMVINVAVNVGRRKRRSRG
ncbi:hypothetical protein Caci_6152 [Catenulispora acidiphila DSM 44928]|uniref:Uncharacterized protein n=1 Tax=Catenulispora acidiphila (strain DSM 44928 / JCM 14897 / NBRC 102108 / NRRL B-24433 / ID139908) TaxID=479433 RepID=C7QIC9_CATAD|nr:hypothetical protein [Catenulispora acidiphila]ACU75006.1 hypothetical protein Caci_6152 [Catenulispora acidiphila DSM 44928]